MNNNKVNWTVRFRNWMWVSGFISQLMIVLQLALVGMNQAGWTDFVLTQEIQGGILTFANAVFVLLSMLGIVQDPTVEGITDSKRAMSRTKPLSDPLKKE